MSGVLRQCIYLRASINGTQPVQLDRRFFRSLRVTNTLLSGAAESDIDLFVRPGLPWPWGLRSMDRIAVDGAVVTAPSTLGEDQWQRIQTGVLTDVPAAEAADTGFHVPLKAANMWHLLEATTENPDQFALRYKQTNTLAGDFLQQMAIFGGFPNLSVEGGPDINTGLVALGAVDPDGFQFNQQYQNLAAIMANVAAMAGRELYADEDGLLNYRPSHYAHDPVGTIPSERLINVSASIDTDAGVINRVQVRYGLQESQFVSGNAPPVGQEIVQSGGGTYDRAHYHDRLLIVAAPWIERQADADWLAQWILSWGMSNNRPAVVQLNFWPEARIGNVYTLTWPKGTRTNYYCASVVHQIQPGGPAVTILGLTYGRPPGFQYNIPSAPANFGQFSAQNGNPEPPLTVTGDQWRTTYYTPTGLTTYQDTPNLGDNLRASSGARYWRDQWSGGPGAQPQDYTVRPCAFDPSYRIPELGNVTLSAGDRIRLASGVIVDCRDTIGTDVQQGNNTGRQLDVFYWTTPAPIPPDFQAVQYLKVANYAGSLPDIPPIGAATPAGNAPEPGRIAGPLTGETGDSQLANFATGIAETLQLYNGHYEDAGTVSAFAKWVINDPTAGDGRGAYTLPNGHADAQCVLFARYCLTRSGYPTPPFAAGKLAGTLVGPSFADVTGRVPAPGDVPYFDVPGSGAPPGSNVSQANGAGHVAIIVAVHLPDSANAGGYVTVAQANCTQRLQDFPLLASGASWVIGAQPGYGPWLGTVRPRHAG